MCGIAGFVTRAPGDSPDSVLARMTDSIRHRGPDGSGYYRDPFASLGHRRLSIIDVAGGHQPMSNEDGALWITYNGEIFNHADLCPDGLRIVTADALAIWFAPPRSSPGGKVCGEREYSQRYWSLCRFQQWQLAPLLGVWVRCSALASVGVASLPPRTVRATRTPPPHRRGSKPYFRRCPYRA